MFYIIRRRLIILYPALARSINMFRFRWYPYSGSFSQQRDIFFQEKPGKLTHVDIGVYVTFYLYRRVYN